MKKTIVLILSALLVIACTATETNSYDWQAKWIASGTEPDAENTWLSFCKTFSVDRVPDKAVACIAVDSKYLLAINGSIVVREGGLKRGPTPQDTYYDTIDIAPWLKSGQNRIDVLVWYFGRQSFSHNSSGKAGLLFDCKLNGKRLISDSTWQCAPNTAFGECGAPKPNYRLPESSLRYDGRVAADWLQFARHNSMPQAVELAEAGGAPWNGLIERPIPMFRFDELADYPSARRSGDTLICALPQNIQFTPYIKLRSATEGQTVQIMTDHYLVYNGLDIGLRCEYITRTGEQEYENYGWLNGHNVYYVIPEGVEVEAVKYRWSGYDTDFTGSFKCSDEFFNTLWQKALNTLYITMRDGYMDCPDRERGQWTGDAVNESGEAFYALSRSSDAISAKWLREVCGWQREDGAIYSPVPSSYRSQELPLQSLATVGTYGLWNYYVYSGDKRIIEDLYPAVVRYLAMWTINPDGTVVHRKGDWNWGDWGANVDLEALTNIWYYMALESVSNIAAATGRNNEAEAYAATAAKLREGFNKVYWTGTEYRSPNYTKPTDDRANALAIVAGMVDKSRFDAVAEVLRNNRHASPYMEKYVFEAMMIMGHEKEALQRHRERFGAMVGNPLFTTLFEGWNIGDATYGGGTVNHAWSGGGLTIMSQYVCGIAPVEAGFKSVAILPQPSGLTFAEAEMESVKGIISSAFEDADSLFTLRVEIPKGVKGIIGTPSEGVKSVSIDGRKVWENGKYISRKAAQLKDSHLCFKVSGGSHTLEAFK